MQSLPTISKNKYSFKLLSSSTVEDTSTFVVCCSPSSFTALTSLHRQQHTLFWEGLAPEKHGGGKLGSGAFADAVKSQFGDLDGLKKDVNAAAAGIQGSGWAWLVRFCFLRPVFGVFFQKTEVL